MGKVTLFFIDGADKELIKNCGTHEVINNASVVDARGDHLLTVEDEKGDPIIFRDPKQVAGIEVSGAVYIRLRGVPIEQD